MPVSSNQYIQKISMEHPIALWSLDDDAYYIKLMSDSARDVGTWQNMNCASVSNITTPDNITLPNPDRPCTRIIGSEVGTLDYNASAFVKSTETFSSNTNPFSISFNLYSYDTDIRWVSLGYQIGDSLSISAVGKRTSTNAQVKYTTSSAHGFTNGQYVTVGGTVPTSGNAGAYDQSGTVIVITTTTFCLNTSKQYNASLAPNEPGGEAFVGEQEEASYAWLANQSKRWLFLSSTFNATVSNAKIRLNIRYDGDYQKTFLINDLVIGQDSLEFASVSSGQTPITIPSTIATSETQAIIAKDFLSDTNDAYYIVQNNNLCIKNSSIPMVSGSSNTTILYKNTGNPSIIFPGFGMLNEYGKYKNYNLETFIRINGNATSPKKIIGPIASDDGVYINGSFIILKINNLIQTAYIGEWSKPMLLNLQYSENSVELWINAEKLISINIANETLTFPLKIATSGTYSGKDQDWIGFYYHNDLTSIEVDTVTIYPYVADSALLKRRLLYAQAIKSFALENLSNQSNGDFVHFKYDVSGHDKNYVFPSFSSWESARVIDNMSIKNNTLNSLSYNLPNIYLDSETYNEWLLSQQAVQNEASKFMTLKPDSNYDNINGYMYLNSNILNSTLSAIYMTIKKPTSSVSEQRLFTVYDKVSKNYFKVSITGSTLSYVFNYLGTDYSEYSTSSGTINSKITVGINIDYFKNSSNYSLSSFFKSNDLLIYFGGMPSESLTFDGKIYKIGLCNPLSYDEISSNFTDGIANIANTLESFIASYTLLPKDFLNNFILDIATKSYWESHVPLSMLLSYKDEQFDLDFLQLNIDYPETTTLSGNDFDTSLELVQSYISFQDNESGLAQSTFNSVVALAKNKIISATTNALNKKYEFTNHSLVYVPKDIDLSNYSLVIHLTMISNIFTYPVNIKYLEICGKTLTENEVNHITSESSTQVEHYSINNGIDDYKNNAGVFITKTSQPYIMLNNNSGIKVVNNA